MTGSVKPALHFLVVYLFVELYLRFATGVNWQFILSPHIYVGSRTIHLIVAWIDFLTLTTLTVITALRTWKDTPSTLRSNVIGTAASLTVYMSTWFVFALPAYEAENAVTYPQAYRYFSAVSGWVRNIVLAAALVFFVRSIAALITRKNRDKRRSVLFIQPGERQLTLPYCLHILSRILLNPQQIADLQNKQCPIPLHAIPLTCRNRANDGTGSINTFQCAHIVF